MKFYRVSYTNSDQNSAGFTWHTSKRTADADAAKYKTHEPEAEVEVIEIKPTKDGILRALNHYASHPDNG